MKLPKNNLDERQEQKLLTIERNGCWLAFWGLFLAWAVQLVLFPGEWERFAGEWLVFMVLAAYIGIACMRSGIWDRRLQPKTGTNAIVSAIAGVVAGVLMGVSSFLRYHKPVGSVAAGLFLAAFCFGLCFGALQLSAAAMRKKQARLEAEPEEENE